MSNKMIPYSVREGLAGFSRAKFAVAASTSAMAVALVLIGLFSLLSYEAQQVSNWLRQRVGELEMFLDEQITESTALALHTRAAATPGVDAADYISRQQAQDVFRQEFGEGAEIFLDEPFLPASIRVRVRPAYANADSLSRMVEEFSSWNRVDEVVFNQPLLVKVQQNLRLLTIAGLALGVIVVLASLFLVANTIRLTIYARRLLIRTMKLVGATDAFIRRPFIVEGVAQGLLAGIVAAMVLSTLYGLLARYLPQLGAASGTVAVLMFVGVVLVGMLLGWLGSLFAVRRFIQNVALH
jgi:cell division transport system permease protein